MSRLFVFESSRGPLPGPEEYRHILMQAVMDGAGSEHEPVRICHLHRDNPDPIPIASPRVYNPLIP